MKQLAILATLKKYLPSILYSVIGLVAVFMLYKLFMRLRAGGLAVGGVIADKAENTTISKQTGIDSTRVQQLRNIARDLAGELETLKDMGFWDKAKHFQLDSDTIDIMQGIKSAAEISVVKNFYETIFTNGRRMLEDLQDVLSTSDLNKIPFISTIY